MNINQFVKPGLFVYGPYDTLLDYTETIFLNNFYHSKPSISQSIFNPGMFCFIKHWSNSHRGHRLRQHRSIHHPHRFHLCRTAVITIAIFFTPWPVLINVHRIAGRISFICYYATFFQIILHSAGLHSSYNYMIAFRQRFLTPDNI